MRMTKDGKPLSPYHLRDHAKATNNPFWEGEARQLLDWAADCLESAEAVIKMAKPSRLEETAASPHNTRPE